MFLGLNRSLRVANRKRLVPEIDWILANGTAVAGVSYVWDDSSTYVDVNVWKD